MASLTTTPGATFTPAVGTFIVSSIGGESILERRNSSGGTWVEVGRIRRAGVDVEQSVAGAQWRMNQVDATAIEVDQ